MEQEVWEDLDCDSSMERSILGIRNWRAASTDRLANPSAGGCSSTDDGDDEMKDVPFYDKASSYIIETGKEKSIDRFQGKSSAW